jgi:signal transduction histidine kinase
MTETQQINTFNRQCLQSFAMVCVLVCGFSLLLIAKLLYSATEQELAVETKQWAAVIANRSISFVLQEDTASLQDALQILDNIDFISHVHVYKTNKEEQDLTFFVGYNRQNRDGLNNLSEQPNKPAQILHESHMLALLTLKQHADFIELAYPIKTQGSSGPDRIIGYIYLNTSLQQAYAKTRNLMLIISSIALVIILTLVFTVRYLLSRIATPIENLADSISTISRQKDFALRCPDMPYQELDWLAQKINIMLGRIEKHIAKQADAERQIIHLNHKLEDKVSQRTDALKESNQDLLSTLEKLHQYQDQLVESEKMASLGDMVAGVAHEVNTPIGLGVTASTLLSDNMAEIRTAFDNKTLKSSQLKKFLTDGEENVSIIYRNLKRAADLISSFKKVAVDQSSEETRRFDVKQLLEEVKLTLAPRFNNTHYQLLLDCPEQLVVSCKPGPINQILVNLIINSLIHGFEGREQGIISITVMKLSKQLQISYTDDGIGVNESIKNKIFEPFITTKRGSGGSGLGLHLVYNLVTQALFGTIHFESITGQGVKFDIIFPYDD